MFQPLSHRSQYNLKDTALEFESRCIRTFLSALPLQAPLVVALDLANG